MFAVASKFAHAVGLMALCMIPYNLPEAKCKGASTGDMAAACKVGDATFESAGLAAECCKGCEDDSCEPATLDCRLLRGLKSVLVKEGDKDTCRLNAELRFV